MAIQAFGLSEILSIVHLKAVQCTIKGGASIYQPTGNSNLVPSGGLNFADDVMQDRKYLLTASFVDSKCDISTIEVGGRQRETTWENREQLQI